MSKLTITEFLEARIAEDERAARAWSDAYNNPGPVPAYHYETGRRHRREWPTLWESLDKFTPARVLAECAAKRAIITQADEASSDRSQVISEFCVGQAERDAEYATDPGALILKALAAVYKDHPDYRQEWAL